MNWFGLFTMLLCVLIAVAIFAHEYGYEKAIKDMSMSRRWVMRNHPANGDWQ
jgi:type III secretory pathway component EscU